MEALLISLAKGFLSLLGASSLFLLQAKQNVVEARVRAVEAKEEQLKAMRDLDRLQPNIEKGQIPRKK